MKAKTKFLNRLTFFLPLILILNCNCEKEYIGIWPVNPPEQINDGLDIGTIEEVNMDPEMISEALGRISQGKYGEVHSILVYKDNMLVLEEYFEGHRYQWDAPRHHGEWVSWDRSTLHGVKSVSKSITSARVGIAIDHGFIESVHQSVFEYLPDHQHLKKDGKDNISIEHLLTMTSGLAWDEWGAPLSSTANDMVGIWYMHPEPVLPIQVAIIRLKHSLMKFLMIILSKL